MRRGNRGSNLQCPKRQYDDETIPSFWNSNWSNTRHTWKFFIVLATCSMIIPILLWSIQLKKSKSHGQTNNLGIVFPLYQYRRQYHFSDRGETGQRVRSWRALNRRRIQGSDIIMNVFGGDRQNRDIDMFYIEIELGVPPKKYYFQIDTGSGISWIYCNPLNTISTLATYGPNGLFVPKDDAYIKCNGDDEKLCQQLQAPRRLSCDSGHNHQCLFNGNYADQSTYEGVFMNESFTVELEDKTKLNVNGLFGCVTNKVLKYAEEPTLTADGLLGFGNCKQSLTEQWKTFKAIKQSILAVCFANKIETTPPSPVRHVGYISMGMDFRAKFGQSMPIWSKLINPGKRIPCSFAANILAISFNGKKIKLKTKTLLDTGSDLTFLATNIFGPLANLIDHYTYPRKYAKVQDDSRFILNEQRACYQPPSSNMAGASPISDFPPLEFEFEGMTKQAPVQKLIVLPRNYLIWIADENKVCVNILEDHNFISTIGGDLMREHLFIYDIGNQRVRWQVDTCEHS